MSDFQQVMAVFSRENIPTAMTKSELATVVAAASTSIAAWTDGQARALRDGEDLSAVDWGGAEINQREKRAIVDGVLAARIWNDAVQPTTAAVDAERDRRVNENFTYGANVFQNRPDDRENIQGAYSSALTAIALNNAQPDDYRWSDPDHDFGWIDADNNLVLMDAQTVMEFGNTAKLHKQRNIFAARLIKDDVLNGTITTLEQIATDPRWP